MEYKRFKSTIVVRMDKGEEILEKIKEIAVKEDIRLAAINALGAVGEFTAGVLNTKEK
ncbi:PCC domain-containing protein, partial [Aminipila sp.]